MPGKAGGLNGSMQHHLISKSSLQRWCVCPKGDERVFLRLRRSICGAVRSRTVPRSNPRCYLHPGKARRNRGPRHSRSLGGRSTLIVEEWPVIRTWLPQSQGCARLRWGARPGAEKEFRRSCAAHLTILDEWSAPKKNRCGGAQRSNR
jgi:hypothetical protein